MHRCYHRQEQPSGEAFNDLRMRGTGFREPGCKHEWCQLAPDWPPTEGSGKHVMSLKSVPETFVSPYADQQGGSDKDGANGDL